MTELPAGIRVLLEPADVARFAGDWSDVERVPPRAVLLPSDVDEVVQIVRWAARTGTVLVPSGGRTGLSGGATVTGDEIVVALDRLDRIVGFDADDRTLTVQAGVTTQAVQAAARDRGLFYPVDFGSRGSAQIGGNIATNAGGIKVLRYGMTRDWVAGLRAVTGAGELLDLNRGLAKNATGYDLRHLLIGSEGTLAIVVEATLRLAPAPPPQQVMLFAVPRLDALMPVFAAMRAGLVLSAFEFFTDHALEHVVADGGRDPFAARAPYYVLAEFDADEDAAVAVFESLDAAGLVTEGVLSQSESQAAELWRLREGITASLARHRPYKNDIAVRVSRVPAFLARVDELFAAQYPGFRVVWFGHIGDGNLHISVLPPEAMDHGRFRETCANVTLRLAALLSEFSGTISAEHGVGLLKKPYLASSRSSVEISLMRQLKAVFDPGAILNRGKIFD